MKSNILYLMISVFFITLLNGCGGPAKQENVTETSGPVDLKNIKLQDLEGNAIKISDFEGQVVFLNFWATWCKPCIAEMPSIERAIDLLKDKKIVFLAASDESVEKIEKFMARFEFDLEFIRVLDDYGNLEIYSLPTTVIYGRDGEIVLNEAGAREWDADDMIEKLSSL